MPDLDARRRVIAVYAGWQEPGRRAAGLGRVLGNDGDGWPPRAADDRHRHQAAGAAHLKNPRLLGPGAAGPASSEALAIGNLRISTRGIATAGAGTVCPCLNA
jgi:hypothetical protein